LQIVKRFFITRFELLLFGVPNVRLMSVVRGALASVALISALPASAAVVLDQEAIAPTPPALSRVVLTIGDRAAPPGSPNPPLVNAFVGQTVTAGVTGILDSIEVQGPFWNTAQGFAHAFNMTLYEGTFGTELGSVIVPVGAVPSTTALNTAAMFGVNVADLGYSVTAGSVFSFSIRLLGPPGSTGLVTIGNVAGTQQAPVFQYINYAGGSAYYSNNGAPLSVTPRDIGFRTYVNATAPVVPEASTWLMMIAGFGLAGMGLRRARFKSAAPA
jgi:PEP-CTERM motif